MSQMSQTLQSQLGGSRPLARVSALLVAGILTGYVIAAHGFTQALFFIFALSALTAFLAARYPWLAVVSPLVIFIVMGIGVSSGLNIGGASINLADVLLLPALAPTIAKVLAGRRDLSYPSVPALLIFVWLVLATALGVYYGNSLSLVRNELHVLFFIVLAYFWAIVELRTPRDVWLASIALIAATAVAGFKSIYISFFVSHFSEGYSQLWQASTTASRELGGQRTILNGADTFFVLSMPLIASFALFFRERRYIAWLSAAFVLTLYGLFISLTRTNWATVLVAILLVMLLGMRTAGRQVVRIGVAVLLICILALAVSSMITFGGNTYDLGELMSRRLEPNPYTGAGNLNYRIMESKALIDQAQEHLVLGNGLGASFDFLEFRGATSVNWAHNGHLWLLLKSGLAGMAVFYLGIAATCWQLIRMSFHAGQRTLSAISLGFGIALASLMIMTLLVNRISNMEGAYFIGLAVALPQIISRINREVPVSAIQEAS
ncbi:MAG: hypothetical protein C4534_04790 [Gaiellales bacterium]|nr:MAG: hypothetical protein C4534_04790 [Gaiellales bacterium]